MDYALPVVFFVVGFAAAFIAGSLRRSRSSGRELQGLQLEDGAVRLDQLGRGANKHGSANPRVEAEAAVSPGSPASQPVEGGFGGKGRRPGAHARRRR